MCLSVSFKETALSFVLWFLSTLCLRLNHIVWLWEKCSWLWRWIRWSVVFKWKYYSKQRHVWVKTEIKNKTCESTSGMTVWDYITVHVTWYIVNLWLAVRHPPQTSGMHFFHCIGVDREMTNIIIILFSVWVYYAFFYLGLETYCTSHGGTCGIRSFFLFVFIQPFLPVL